MIFWHNKGTNGGARACTGSQSVQVSAIASTLLFVTHIKLLHSPTYSFRPLFRVDIIGIRWGLFIIIIRMRAYINTMSFV